LKKTQFQEIMQFVRKNQLFLLKALDKYTHWVYYIAEVIE